MTKYITLFIFLLASCKGSVRNNHDSKVSQKPIQKDTISKVTPGSPELVEAFLDSTTIGRKGFNKIELKKYSIADSNYVIIRFFSKQKGEWVVRNEFHFGKDGIADCDPQISDFNNDGLKDITYVSTIAARGGNQVRTLFIYDKPGDRLIHIRNSEDYPNMLYNKKLHCIDAFLLYGCTMTAFVKLEADTLRMFASVEQCDSITVKTYAKDGTDKIILKKANDEDEYTRFSNYDPLE